MLDIVFLVAFLVFILDLHFNGGQWTTKLFNGYAFYIIFGSYIVARFRKATGKLYFLNFFLGFMSSMKISRMFNENDVIIGLVIFGFVCFVGLILRVRD